MQSISFARSTAGSTSSLRRKNVAPRRIVNTQAQAKVRLKSAISFFLFFLVGVGRSEGHTEGEESVQEGLKCISSGKTMEDDDGLRVFVRLQSSLKSFFTLFCIRCVLFLGRKTSAVSRSARVSDNHFSRLERSFPLDYSSGLGYLSFI